MQLLPPTQITTAGTVTGSPFQIRQGPSSQGEAMAVAMQATFTYGSGGTNCAVYLQTSFDGGTTWCDCANIVFLLANARAVAAVSSTTSMTVPVNPVTDGTMAANTVTPGMVAEWWRVKVVSTGTYAGGTTVRVDSSPVMVPAGVGSFN
jgi:hypothetical protein